MLSGTISFPFTNSVCKFPVPTVLVGEVTQKGTQTTEDVRVTTRTDRFDHKVQKRKAKKEDQSRTKRLKNRKLTSSRTNHSAAAWRGGSPVIGESGRRQR